MKRISFILLVLICLANPVLAKSVKPSKKPEQPFQIKAPFLLLKDIPEIKDMQLSKRDAKNYATVFELQKNGDWHQADKFISDINDKAIMGHVLYQRYMHPNKYVSSFFELKTWLYTYNDLPNADVIYDLAMKKKPQGQLLSIDPANHQYITPGIVENYGCFVSDYRHAKWRSPANWKKVKSFKKEIKSKLRRTMPTRAIERMKTSSVAKDILDKVEYDLLQTNIASAYLYVGKTELALEYAKKSIERSKDDVDEAYWVAGLASWKLNKLEDAIDFFDKLYNIEDCDPWKRTAAAYWNARMYKTLGKNRKHKTWLYNAMKFPATFYGQLATYEAEEDLDLNLNVPEFTEDDFKIIANNNSGRRAIYLINAGQFDLAEKELMGIDLRSNKKLEKAVFALVSYTNMAQMSLVLGSSLKPDSDSYDRYDYAIYPVPSWAPKGGFELDPAIVYAFIKQESRFDPNAVSSSGARGLMQIMPNTAKHITGKPYDKDYYKDKLFNPENNIDLGEKYLQELLRDRGVKNSLIMLPVAYNSGPGTLRMWLENMSFEDDPLLFIETIPYKETRVFVKKVLANYWIYQKLLGEENTSAREIIQGKWPQLKK